MSSFPLSLNSGGVGSSLGGVAGNMPLASSLGTLSKWHGVTGSCLFKSLSLTAQPTSHLSQAMLNNQLPLLAALGLSALTNLRHFSPEQLSLLGINPSNPTQLSSKAGVNSGGRAISGPGSGSLLGPRLGRESEFSLSVWQLIHLDWFSLTLLLKVACHLFQNMARRGFSHPSYLTSKTGARHPYSHISISTLLQIFSSHYQRQGILPTATSLFHNTLHWNHGNQPLFGHTHPPHFVSTFQTGVLPHRHREKREEGLRQKCKFLLMKFPKLLYQPSYSLALPPHGSP